MPALNPGLDLRAALQGAATFGAAFVPGALAETFRTGLLADLADVPFAALPERAGRKGVRQQAEIFVVRDGMHAYPHVRELRDELVCRLREQRGHLPGVVSWFPDHASVQRYVPGSLGVSPHLDGKRFRYLVAVFTLDGAASFALCRDRAGTVLREWEALQGSLVLMRAPGLAGSEDGRPLHTVSGPTEGPRTSLTFRMTAAKP